MGYVHTILRDTRLQFKVGSPGAYAPAAVIDSPVSSRVARIVSPVVPPVTPELAPCRYGDHAQHQLRNRLNPA